MTESEKFDVVDVESVKTLTLCFPEHSKFLCCYSLDDIKKSVWIVQYLEDICNTAVFICILFKSTTYYGYSYYMPLIHTF